MAAWYLLRSACGVFPGPVLFGFLTVLKKPLLIPGTLGYLILV
jgi:hypothetical protein